LPTSETLNKIFDALPPSDTANLPSTLYSVAGRNGPRWIFPAAANVNRVLANWWPYRRSSRILWLGILEIQKFGAVPLLPRLERLQLTNSTGIDWRAVGWAGSTAPVPVIYVGTPGPRQKAVVHLVDPASGSCSAVVKIPLQIEAKSAIRRESVVLASLEEEDSRIAPRLIYLDDRQGVATQHFVNGTSGSRKFLSQYQDLLESMMLPDEHTTLAGHSDEWHEHALWDSMEPADLQLLTSAFA